MNRAAGVISAAPGLTDRRSALCTSVAVEEIEEAEAFFEVERGGYGVQ